MTTMVVTLRVRRTTCIAKNDAKNENRTCFVWNGFEIE